MSQISNVPEILFSNEELIDKKKITSILVKNNVEFYPVRNYRDEYKTTIRVRSPTPEKKNSIQKLDKSTKSKVDDLMALMAQSTQKKEHKQEDIVIEGEDESDPQTIPTLPKNYISGVSKSETLKEGYSSASSKKNEISEFNTQEHNPVKIFDSERKSVENFSSGSSHTREKNFPKLIENIHIEEKTLSKVEIKQDSVKIDDSIVRNLDDPQNEETPPSQIRPDSNNYKILNPQTNSVLTLSKDQVDNDAKSNSSSSVKTPTLGVSKPTSLPESQYNSKKVIELSNPDSGPKNENFSSIPSSNKSGTESMGSLGGKKGQKKKINETSKFGITSDPDFAKQAEFLVKLTKEESEKNLKTSLENTAKFQTEPVEYKTTFSSNAIKIEDGQYVSKPISSSRKPDFHSLRSNAKQESLPESVKLKRDKEIIFIPDENEGVIITEEIFRILMPHIPFAKFLSVLKRKGLKFYQIPGRNVNSPKKFMESLLIDPNSSFLSDFHPQEHAQLSKNLYPKNWTPNSLGSFLFPNSGSMSPKSRGRSYSPARRLDIWNDNRSKSSKILNRPKLKASRDSSAEISKEIADLINSKQLSEAIKEIEEQPSNIKSKDYSDINFSGMKPVFVVDSDNFHAGYMREEESKIQKSKLKDQKYDIKESKAKIERLIKTSSNTGVPYKLRQVEQQFKTKYYTALGYMDSNSGERPESFRSAKQPENNTTEKSHDDEAKNIPDEGKKKVEPIKLDKLLKDFEHVAEASRKKTEKLFEKFKKKENVRERSPPKRNASIGDMNSQELINYHATIANKAKHMTLLKSHLYRPKEKFYEPLRRKADN